MIILTGRYKTLFGRYIATSCNIAGKWPLYLKCPLSTKLLITYRHSISSCTVTSTPSEDNRRSLWTGSSYPNFYLSIDPCSSHLVELFRTIRNFLTSSRLKVMSNSAKNICKSFFFSVSTIRN